MPNPDQGFTSDVIRDARRFVGRTELIRNCVRALNTPAGVIGVYGKRGLGKSSLLRQIQQMALGDYSLLKHAGIGSETPSRPRTYVTVYYQCDSMIENATDLLKRLCNDQNSEDGLLRLVPDDGKELTEFTRSAEASASVDLKVTKWGAKGVAGTKYARVVENDIVQTFRNFVNAAIDHQAKKRLKRDGLLILLDEFDVIRDKAGLGSLIKSLTSPDLKFGVCGIGHDLSDLIEDHESVERLLEQGAVHVHKMSDAELHGIIHRAEDLFKGVIRFESSVSDRIVAASQGYPYFTQMLGRACVEKANERERSLVDDDVYNAVLEDVRSGRAFPSLETKYQRAIGNSSDRQLLLHLLADQTEDSTMLNEDVGRVFLKRSRQDAADLGVDYVDQLIPRLVEEKHGVLERLTEKQGVYEFKNPVFRLYVQLRSTA